MPRSPERRGNVHTIRIFDSPPCFSVTGNTRTFNVEFRWSVPLRFYYCLQIVWKMLFHLARFSVFMVVVMVGFALSFLTLFSNCEGELGERFEDFGASLLTLFHAMLGGASFDMFDDEIIDCKGASWDHHAGIFLLVAYLIVMSILLLNLLIAVLSTVHDKVSATRKQAPTPGNV